MKLSLAKVGNKSFLLIFLLITIPILAFAVIYQRYELRKRAATGEPPVVCWNRVVEQNNNYYWPDSCGGASDTGTDCAQVMVQLTASEAYNYINWRNNGKPSLPRCQLPYPTPTCIPRRRCMDPLPGEPMCYPNIPQSGWICPKSTPTPTPLPLPPEVLLEFLIRFAGVAGNQAEGAIATIRFIRGEYDYITPPIVFQHLSNGIYKAKISLDRSRLPAQSGYSIIVKGEKHVARKFCQVTGQTTPCLGASNISLATNQLSSFAFDFSGLPLDPGDLPPQDGSAGPADYSALQSLLSVPSGSLTSEQLYKGDLNYDGRVDLADVFLLRKTLETRLDEN